MARMSPIFRKALVVIIMALISGCESLERSQTGAFVEGGLQVSKLSVGKPTEPDSVFFVIGRVEASVKSSELSGTASFDSDLLATMTVREIMDGRPAFVPASEVRTADTSADVSELILAVTVHERTYIQGIREMRAITATAHLTPYDGRDEDEPIVARAVFRGDSRETVVSPTTFHRVVGDTVAALFDSLEQVIEEA